MLSANYLIFARRAYQQPLEWIGDLRFDVEPTPEALDQRAREQFGGESWVEMVAIPEAAIVRVIPME
ncbi:MAG: hypothetical protein ACRDH2_01090 [Anaerolineales bacterium]